jgi:hypothetical protein
MPGGAGDGLVGVLGLRLRADQGSPERVNGYKYANRTFDSSVLLVLPESHRHDRERFKVAGARVVTGAQIPYTASGA